MAIIRTELAFFSESLINMSYLGVGTALHRTAHRHVAPEWPAEKFQVFERRVLHLGECLYLSIGLREWLGGNFRHRNRAG